MIILNDTYLHQWTTTDFEFKFWNNLIQHNTHNGYFPVYVQNLCYHVPPIFHIILYLTCSQILKYVYWRGFLHNFPKLYLFVHLEAISMSNYIVCFGGCDISL